MLGFDTVHQAPLVRRRAVPYSQCMPSYNSPLATSEGSQFSYAAPPQEDGAAISGVHVASSPVAEANTDAPLPTLDDAMRTHIGHALVRARGRIEGKAGAADLLGVNPHTLRGKMRRLKIDWSRFRTA